MDREKWLSLGLNPEHRELYNSGGFKTVEAADMQVVGIAKQGNGYYPLTTTKFREEAVVIATNLRMMM